MKKQKLAAAMIAATAITVVGASTAHAQGTLYVGQSNGAIATINTATGATNASFITGVSALQGVAVGAGGSVLAMDTNDYGGIFAYQGINGAAPGTLVKATPFASFTGAATGTMGSPNPGYSGANGGYQHGFGTDAAGNLYVTNYNGRVDKYNTNGTINTYALAASPGNANAVNAGSSNGTMQDSKIDAAGNIYLANFYSTPAASALIYEFSSAGTLLTTFATGGAGAIGFNIDSAGDLFVANTGYGNGPIANTISEFVVGSTTPTTFYGGTGSLIAGNNPQDIAFDNLGNMYVTNTKANNILEFAAGANGIVAAGTTPTVFANGLTAPAFLAFVPAAAPEPSQTAALGLGVLGIAGLIFTARKRRACVCA